MKPSYSRKVSRSNSVLISSARGAEKSPRYAVKPVEAKEPMSSARQVTSARYTNNAYNAKGLSSERINSQRSFKSGMMSERIVETENSATAGNVNNEKKINKKEAYKNKIYITEGQKSRRGSRNGSRKVSRNNSRKNSRNNSRRTSRSNSAKKQSESNNLNSVTDTLSTIPIYENQNPESFRPINMDSLKRNEMEKNDRSNTSFYLNRNTVGPMESLQGDRKATADFTEINKLKEKIDSQNPKKKKFSIGGGCYIATETNSPDKENDHHMLNSKSNDIHEIEKRSLDLGSLKKEKLMPRRPRISHKQRVATGDEWVTADIDNGYEYFNRARIFDTGIQLGKGLFDC
jgi:hypothetical protein